MASVVAFPTFFFRAHHAVLLTTMSHVIGRNWVMEVVHHEEFRGKRNWVQVAFWSFADLWVDFLLKETEERGKSESAGAHMKLEGDQHLRSPSTASAAASVSNSRKANMPSLFSVASSNIQTNLVQPEHLDREFSTIPLTPSIAPLSETTARTSRH
ncbi:hypothetical protein Scep_026015 [Stephania cephalantha]|uniref:Uncharacterized protein n=1 Tax=Stephania cephalantha TaxID=152367 RepID=A0AAP0HS37_9MAGN